jgi:phage terminase large subunit-like protein
LIPPPLIPSEAESALKIFRELRIVDAPGSPRIGDACRPWVMEFAASIFGAYHPNLGRRFISEWLLLISKKNWKSGLAASIMLTVLIRNWRQSAEFLIVAPTTEVANNSFFAARDSVRADPELSDMMHVQDHVRTITHLGRGATLKVIAADSEAVSGKKAAGILIDELWLFGKRPGAENMLREATGGLASRPEGFIIYLSTQSDDPPAGVFKTKLDYARKVRDGKIHDPNFQPVLYEFPQRMVDEKAYLSIDNLHITNPNLGASVDREFLARGLAQAQEGGDESLVGFLAKHANVEIGLNLRSDRWAGVDYWAGNAETDLSLDEVIERSDVLTVGIDGGGLDDLLGLAVLGREADTGRWLHWGHAWAHPSVLERRKAEAPRFKDFAKGGDLTLVSQIGEDVDEVIDIVQRCNNSGKLDKIGVDQIGIGAVLDALFDAEIGEDQVVGISQGWRLSGAIKTTERRLAEGALRHCGQPLMAWSVGNCKVEPRGNAITITKQTSGTAKIDPVMALFNAVELMSRNPEPKSRTVTEDALIV